MSGFKSRIEVSEIYDIRIWANFLTMHLFYSHKKVEKSFKYLISLMSIYIFELVKKSEDFETTEFRYFNIKNSIIHITTF